MLVPSFVTATLAMLSCGIASVTGSAIPRASGSLSLDSTKPALTFKYSTSAPDASNWIGIWDAYYGGPDNGTSVKYSTTWDYAPSASGSLQIPTTKLTPGKYKAYYLAKGGYTSLADPIYVWVAGSDPLHFTVTSFTTLNGRAGDAFKASVGGLLTNPPDGNSKFSKASGDAWVQVSSDGTITGTPTASGNGKVTVKATASNGSTATLQVTIPVVAAGSPLVSNLSVLTFNMWQGGTNINDYNRKQIAFLTSNNYDLVGLQEAFFNDAIRLAEQLGWYHLQTHDASIISRYPIVQNLPATDISGAALISLDGTKSQVIFWNAHLAYDPYGPYDFCFSNMTAAQVTQREADSGRTPQIIEITQKMQSAIANAANVPVLLTGDFNAPSQLDWTAATADQHCGVGAFKWPSSDYPLKAGLVDSYREVHPDPVADPAITWSPIYLTDAGKPEPMDRIDFIYHKGFAKVVSSKNVVVGSPTAEPNHANNEWTSDHRAVNTIFKVA